MPEESPERADLNGSLLDAGLDGVMAFDRECRYTAWNAAMERISGVRRGQVLGRVAFEVFPFLKETGEDRFLYEALEGRSAVSEARPYYITGSGRRGYFDGHYSPLRDERGGIIGGVGVIRDVTERRVAEDALRRSEERLRLALRAAAAGHWYFDAAAAGGFWSDECWRLYGLEPRAEAPTLDLWLSVVAPEDRGSCLHAVQTAARDRGELKVEYRLAQPEGGGRWLLSIGNIVSGPEEPHAKMTGITLDVTDRKRAEEALRASEERLLRAQRAAGLGTWDWDLASGAVVWSDGIYELLGLAPGSVNPSLDRWLEFVLPEDVGPTRRAIEGILAAGGEFTVEFRVRGADGAVHWLAAIGRVEAGEGGAPRRLLGVNIDVTERKREELDRKFLLELGDKIRLGELEPAPLLDEVTRATSEHLGAARCLFIEIDEAENRGTIKHEFRRNDLPPVPGEYRISDYSPATLEEVKRGRLVVNHDAENDPRTAAIFKTSYEPYRERSYVSVPLFTDGRWAAIFWVSDDRARSWTAREVALIEAAGERAWLAAEKLRHEAGLLRSQETLSLAMGAGRMGAWSLDLATGAVYWSPELEAIFGLAPGGFAGTLDAFYDNILEEDRGRVAAEVRRAIDEYRGYVVEFRHRPADGSLKWMEGRGHATYSGEGRPANVFGIGIDITERKRAELTAELLAGVVGDFVRVSTPEEIVRAVGERLNNFMGASTCAFVEIDETAESAVIKYEWHEEGVPSLAGEYRLPEFVTPEFLQGALSGRTLVIRDVKTDARIADPAPWAAMKLGAHVNVPLIRKGEWRFSLCVYHTNAYDWREDEVNLMIELASRVWTRLERAFAEQERERLLQWESSARLRAEEANRLKDEFLATVSHELRTPLTAITGWAHLLETGALDAEMTRHAVSVIRRNCEQQRQIVEDVLDVSGFITGKLKIERETVDLGGIVLAAVETVRPSAEARGIRLLPDLKPGVEVSGDPVRLQQVVWNLLTNALKFTPSGGQVGVSVGRMPTHARVEVSDTGQGISPEFLPHVFDRFRQADSSTTRQHGGLGLGLSIVRHLVEAHGGSVHAFSAGEGRGATFTVDLPLPVAPRDEEIKSSGQGEAPVGPPPEPLAATPAGKDDDVLRPLVGLRVLLVEDEPDALEMLAFLLRQGGAAVTAVSSAAEALDALGSAVPDVIVADVAMPEADGYELMRRVRSLGREAGGATPAVALTAHATEADRARALRSGFQKHLAKPVGPEVLYAAVADLAGRSARRRF